MKSGTLLSDTRTAAAQIDTERDDGGFSQAVYGDTTAFHEADQRDRARQRSQSWRLFLRTFFLIALLLFIAVALWSQIVRHVRDEAATRTNAEAVSEIVMLSRSALMHTDAFEHQTLLAGINSDSLLRIRPAHASDQISPAPTDLLSRLIQKSLSDELIEGLAFAGSLNGDVGPWTRYQVGNKAYWVSVKQTEVGKVEMHSVAIWVGLALALSLLGAALIARELSRHYVQIVEALRMVRQGNFSASRLNESSKFEGVREVNSVFNSMVNQIGDMEQDRAVMLAGISHDLRTPLARLRLEAEMSVQDEAARGHMIGDIEQLDMIIDKFLEYARPGPASLQPVMLKELLRMFQYTYEGVSDLQLQLEIGGEYVVQADDVDLGRVIANILENARKYGKTPGQDFAQVHIKVYNENNEYTAIEIQDQGPGVPKNMLGDLTKPFFRGDAVRTSATGAGLGLSIVEKAVRRLGGRMVFLHAKPTGLLVRISLKRV